MIAMMQMNLALKMIQFQLGGVSSKFYFSASTKKVLANIDTWTIEHGNEYAQGQKGLMLYLYYTKKTQCSPVPVQWCMLDCWAHAIVQTRHAINVHGLGLYT